MDIAYIHHSETTNVKYKTHVICEITLHVAYTGIQNRCNTVYPRKMVCFRCIIVNTLHNGDDKECYDDHHDRDHVSQRMDSLRLSLA